MEIMKMKKMKLMNMINMMRTPKLLIISTHEKYENDGKCEKEESNNMMKLTRKMKMMIILHMKKIMTHVEQS